jgi:hypothetical protein
VERKIREQQSWYREGGNRWLVRSDLAVFSQDLGAARR